MMKTIALPNFFYWLRVNITLIAAPSTDPLTIQVKLCVEETKFMVDGDRQSSSEE